MISFDVSKILAISSKIWSKMRSQVGSHRTFRDHFVTDRALNFVVNFDCGEATKHGSWLLANLLAHFALDKFIFNVNRSLMPLQLI